MIKDSRVRNALWLVTFLLALCAVVLGLVWSVSGAEPDQVQFVFRTVKAINKPPACLVANGDGSCRVDLLAAARVQVRDLGWIYGDAWTTWEGKAYHAHVWRIPYGAGYWLWWVSGSRIWWSKIKKWDQLSADVGPVVALPAVSTHPACAQVGAAALVNVTSDAGTLQQPNPYRTCSPAPRPSDAGLSPDTCHVVKPRYPDGSVAACGTPTRYWLLRNRFGGETPGKWSDVDAGLLLGPATKLPPGGPDEPEQWVTPDAAIKKTCYGVPVGTSCP